jgi:hypothetical protein
MAFALNRQSTRRLESARSSSICRVHSCVRCATSIASREPCSFASGMARICPSCAGQEHALAHLPLSRTPWGAPLARMHRA